MARGAQETPDIRESIALLSQAVQQLIDDNLQSRERGALLDAVVTQLTELQLHPQEKETHPLQFTGKQNENAAEWISKFEFLAASNRWNSDDQKIRSLGKYMKEAAWTWYSLSVLPVIDTITLADVKKLFMARYGLTEDQALQRAFNRSQKDHEGVGSFADDIQRLLKQAGSDISDLIYKSIFMRGLRADLASAVAITMPKTFEEALRNALALEANSKTRRLAAHTSQLQGLPPAIAPSTLPTETPQPRTAPPPVYHANLMHAIRRSPEATDFYTDDDDDDFLDWNWSAKPAAKPAPEPATIARPPAPLPAGRLFSVQPVCTRDLPDTARTNPTRPILFDYPTFRLPITAPHGPAETVIWPLPALEDALTASPPLPLLEGVRPKSCWPPNFRPTKASRYSRLHNPAVHCRGMNAESMSKCQLSPP